jgi:hypothetical protein
MNQENVNKPIKSENLSKEELKSAVGGRGRTIKVPNEIIVQKVRGKNPPGAQDPSRHPTRI